MLYLYLFITHQTVPIYNTNLISIVIHNICNMYSIIITRKYYFQSNIIEKTIKYT